MMGECRRGIVCRVLGHKWQWKWWEMNKRDFYYCLRCGKHKEDV